MKNYTDRIRFSDVRIGAHFGTHDARGFFIYERIPQESNGGNARWLNHGLETIYRFDKDEIVYSLGEAVP